MKIMQEVLYYLKVLIIIFQMSYLKKKIFLLLYDFQFNVMYLSDGYFSKQGVKNSLKNV